MTDYTKENDWVHDMVMACKQDPNNSDINVVALYHVIDLIRQDEREACAKLCEEFGRNLGGYKAHEDSHDDGWQDACCEIETSIRKRGEQA